MLRTVFFVVPLALTVVSLILTIMAPQQRQAEAEKEKEVAKQAEKPRIPEVKIEPRYGGPIWGSSGSHLHFEARNKGEVVSLLDLEQIEREQRFRQRTTKALTRSPTTLSTGDVSMPASLVNFLNGTPFIVP